MSCQEQIQTDTHSVPNRVLYLIRFASSNHHSCRNSVIAKIPIHSIYDGRVLGITKEIDVLETNIGEWCEKYRLLLLEFDNMRAATMWFECTPAIKQHDWLGGTDHVAVEINSEKGRALQTGDYLQILNLNIPNRDRFMREYVAEAEPRLREWEASPGLTATTSTGHTNVKVFRGTWMPQDLVINHWKSSEQFHQAYCSEEYKPLKEKRQQAAGADVIFFKMDSVYDAS